MRGGSSCFSREIPIGGSNMTQAVARRLGVEGFEAEAIKRSSEDHQTEVRTAIGPVLEDLASELMLSMDYVEHNEGLTVTEILLSGGGVLAPGAAEYIEQSVARPTRLWNPLEGLRVDVDRLDVEELEAWAPSLVVAVVTQASGDADRSSYSYSISKPSSPSFFCSFIKRPGIFSWLSARTTTPM